MFVWPGLGRSPIVLISPWNAVASRFFRTPILECQLVLAFCGAQHVRKISGTVVVVVA